MATIVKASSGLLYETKFTDLDGWSSGTANGLNYFSAVNDPAFITFGYHPIDVLFPRFGQFDAYGVRQGSLFIEDDVWYLVYDGCGLNKWYAGAPIVSNIAVSYDRGLTWNRFENFGPTTDSGGTPLTYGYALGGIEKYGSTYYLYRVILTSSNFGPYSGDVWSTSNLLGGPGGWTFVGSVPHVPGTRTSAQVVPGKPIKVGSTYYLFEQTKGAGSDYIIGKRTSSTPYGTWTQDDATIVTASDFPVPGFASTQPENPKPFFHSGVYGFTANCFPTQRTSYNVIVTSPSIDDWSSKKIRFIQRECSLDCDPDTTLLGVGVLSPVTGPEGALVTGSNGFIAVVFDAAGVNDATYAYAWLRKLRSACLEPSPYALQYNGDAATVRSIVRPLNMTDFVAEYTVEFTSTVSGSNIGLYYRGDATGNNGYRVIVNGTGGRLRLEKIVSGSISTVASGAGSMTSMLLFPSRIKVVVSGTNHKLYLDGELQINATDATFATGTRLWIFGTNAVTAQVRLLSIRSSETVTLNGLQPGASVIVRSDGKFPITSCIADANGQATFSHTHYPLETFEVDGVDYTPSGGIWGGDVYTGSDFATVSKRSSARKMAMQ